MKPESKVCPRCGTVLPDAAPQGLCPKCLLAGLGTVTEHAPPTAGRPEPPPVDVVAATFPQLEVLELVGHGGMGAVYKARQPRLDRLVALKILPESAGQDGAFAERFTREARVLARLNHPNIVTLHDFGRANGFYYLLMEFVDGVNLRQAMQAGRFTPEQALSIVPHICEALQYAHAEGVLHRDIKPENILLDARGRVKIADFGIAKVVGQTEPGRDVPGAGASGPRPAPTQLTASGAALGTPNYMAPEQLANPATVDQRADIYSLGVVFYEMLTGELPLGRFPPPSAKTPVDPRIDDVVLRALERERERRFQTAAEVKTRIESITGAASGAAVAGPTPVPIPPGSGTVAPPSIGLRPEHKPLVLFALLILLGLKAGELLGFTSMFVTLGVSVLHSGLSGIAHFAVSAGFALWLVRLVWRYRAELLRPLGIEAVQADAAWLSAALRNVDGQLSLAATAVLLAMTASVIAFVVVLVGQLIGSLFGRFDAGEYALAMAVPLLFALVAAGWARRRGEAKVEPGPPPPWTRQAGLGFLSVALVAFMPTLFARGLPFEWNSLAWLAVTGIALLTRSRSWRQAALGVNTAGLAISTCSLTAWLAGVTAGGRLPDASSGLPNLVQNLVAPVVLGGLGLCGFLVGLWLLSRRDWCAALRPVADSDAKSETGTVVAPWRWLRWLGAAGLAVVLALALYQAWQRSRALSTPPPRVAVKPAPAELSVVGALPIGAIRLVAIANHPSTNSVWWRPDGLPATEHRFRNLTARTFAEELERPREFVFLRQGLPEGASTLMWRFDPPASTWGKDELEVDGEPRPDYELVTAALPASAQTVTVKAGVATDPWETVAPLSQPGGGSYDMMFHGLAWRISYPPPVEAKDGTTVLTVSFTREPDWEVRVVAVNTRGEEIAPASQGIVNDQMVARFRNLSPATLTTFRFQARRYRWVEFRNVALDPR